MCGYFKSREPGGNEPTPRANWQWVLIASGELKHCGSFKRGLPDLAGAAAAKKKVWKWHLRTSCCQWECWLFQEVKHFNGVCARRHVLSYMVAAWANWLPELRWWGQLPRDSLRGSEQASTMLDWAEAKGKATLVPAKPLSILRSSPGQKRITHAQQDSFRHKRPLNETQHILKITLVWKREEKVYREL